MRQTVGIVRIVTVVNKAIPFLSLLDSRVPGSDPNLSGVIAEQSRGDIAGKSSGIGRDLLVPDQCARGRLPLLDAISLHADPERTVRFLGDAGYPPVNVRNNLERVGAPIKNAQAAAGADPQ